MTQSNVLVGAGVVVGLILLIVVLMNVLDSPPPEAVPSSTTIETDQSDTTSTSSPSSSTSSSTTSTTSIPSTTTSTAGGAPFDDGGGNGGTAGSGSGGGTTSTTSTTTTPTTTTPPTTTPPVVNVPPVADNETATTDEDTSVTGLNVLPGDTDADGDALDVTAIGPVSNGGTAVLNPDNTVDFTPGASFQNLQMGAQRVSSLTYTLSDGQGGTDTGLVTFTVTGLNDAPVANPDAATTPEGTPFAVPAAAGVLSDDTDIDAADTLAVTPFTGTLPLGGALTLNADGSFSYDPTGLGDLDPGEAVDDTFTYTVTDSQGATDTGVLTITVTGENTAPVVTPATVSVAEKSANGTTVHTVDFTDPDPGQTHTFAITAGNIGGAFAIDPGTGAITVADSTALDFETTSTFSLTVAVTDDGIPPATGTDTITVNLTDVNEAPIVDAATFAVDEDAAPGTAVGVVTFTDPEDALQNHTFAITAGNTGGALAIDPSTGALTVAAALDFETTPSYSLTVEVTDDGTPVLTGSATITVNVTNVNEPPSITAPASISAVREVPVVVSGISVVDPDAGDIEVSLAVADGTLEIDETASSAVVTGDGTGNVTITGTVTEINAILADSNGLIYTSNAGTDPSDNLQLDVDDGLNTASATVTIQFNQAPVANDLILSTDEDTQLVVTLSATDADDDDLTFAILTGPANGSLSAIGPVDCTTVNICTADVTYTPNGDFNGADQFTFEVDDGTNSDTATVAITVDPVNDAPVITLSGSTPSFTEGSASVVVDGALTVTDIDDTALVSGTVSITVGLFAGDTLTFTPAGGITDTDLAPGVLALSGTTTLANWETTLQSVQFGTTSDNPTNATRTVSFTVNDGDLDSATVTKDVTVVPVNDAPVLDQPDTTALSYDENAAPTIIAPNITVTDVDSTNLVGATIDIGTGFATGQDVLSLGTNPQNGITAAYDPATGTLTLTGTSTVANYQAALRDIRYANSSDDPSPATRTITFQVDDGPGPNDLSNIVSRDVTVTPVNDPPVAPAHTYAATANMAVDIPAATGLLAGATDLEAGTTLTVGTVSATTPSGGTISNVDNASGAFRFNPPPGVTGPVTFTYTVCDNGNPAPQACSAPATVTFNVAGPVIWFVDDSAAGGGTGRLTDPFQTVAAAGTAIGANTGQRVFVYSGTYTQGIALNSGGWLVGQQVTGASFDTVMGITPATGTIARPAIGTGTATLQNTVALNTNAVVRGVAINSTANTAMTESIVAAITGVDVTQTTITATSGTALSLSDVAGTFTFTDLDKNGAGPGIALTNVAANVTVPAAGSIGSTSGAAVDIDGGTGAFSFAGPINNSTSTGRTIEVTNHNTGAVQFTGVITGGGTGINLDNNDTSTISFTGGLTLSTGANPAFTALNGGSVTATDPGGSGIAPNNTIITSTGTAVNVSGTNIGAAGINFLSISTSGASSGIVLNGTGTAGGLTVTGTGAAGTGGTIQNSGGAGISLTSTSAVNLASMNVTGSGGDGITGSSVTGLSLTGVQVTNNGNTVGEAGIDFVNLVGTSTWSNVTVSGSAEDNAVIRNTSGTPLTLNVTTSSFSNNSSIGNDGLLVEAGGTASITVNVTGSTFAAHRGDHFQAAALNSGVLDVTFTGNTLSGGHPTALGQGITINAATGVAFGGYQGTVTYDINDNTINGAILSAITTALGTSASSSSFVGTISDNIIGTSGVALSCSTQAFGVYVDARGNGTHTAAVRNNVIRQCFDRGIQSEAGDGNGVLNLTVQGNTIDQQVDPAAREAIQTNHGITSTNVFGIEDSPTVCLQIGGAGALANIFSHGAGAPDDFRLRKRFGATVRLPGYAGGTGQDATSLAQVVAFVQGQNTGSTGEPGSASASGAGGGYTGGAACPTP